MPKIIPSSTVSQIIIYRLEGKSRKETATITGTSETKVQQIWNDFREKVGDANFEALSQLGEFIRSKNLSFAQWVDEFCIRMRLEKLGVKLDANLDSFVDDLYLVCKEHKISPTTIVNEMINLRNISSQSKIPIGKMSQHYSKIKSETEQLLQRHQQLSQENTQLKKDTETATKETTNVFAQKKVTLKELDEYVAARNNFKKFGVSVNDLSKAAKVIISIENYGWDHYQIIKHLNEKSNYTKQITQLESKKDSLDTEISSNQQTIDKQTKQIESNHTTILNQKSRIKELAIQDTQLVEALDIRENMYKFKIQRYDSDAQVSLKKVQKISIDAIEQTAKKVTEDQEKFCKDQKNSFAQIGETLSKAVADVALSVQAVASLKFVHPIYQLLSIKATPFEAIQGTLMALGSFLVQYPNDPNHSQNTLNYAKNFYRALQGDLKRLS
jgi:hypothetical protein